MDNDHKLLQRKNDLQKRMGAFPVVIIETFMNWGKTQTMKVLSVKPKTVKEVQNVVKAAAIQPQYKIRCVGDAKSWSPLFPDEGDILMHIENLVPNNKERIRLNEPAKDGDDVTVTIAPGVSTGELNDFFTKNNLCLMSDVILNNVMYGGVIATGCHGVGKDQKSVSDAVMGMSLVHGTGDVKSYDFKALSGNQDFCNSLKCNLGLFGIMTDITLKVEPMAIVEVVNDFSCTVNDVFYNPKALKKLYEDNWSVEIFWFPFNSMRWNDALMVAMPSTPVGDVWDAKRDHLWIRKINKKEVPSKPCLSGTDYGYKESKPCWGGTGHDHGYEWAKDLASTTFGRVISENLNKHPRYVPSFMKAGFEMVQRFNKETTYEYINKAIHYQSFIEVFPVVNMEFAFNVDETFEAQAKAMQVVVDQCQMLVKGVSPKFPLSVAMEMRWMSSSDALLCPARAVSSTALGGSGKTLCLEVLGIAEQPDNNWENFTKEVTNKWLQIKPGGKTPIPHWAKQWSYLPDIIPYVQKGYGEAMTTFKKQLTAGGESYSVFLNETLNQVIFPEKAKKLEPKHPRQQKTKPKMEPEEMEMFGSFKTHMGKANVDSWKEFWVSVGEQVWSFPHAGPRMNIERQWKMAHGLMEELHQKFGDDRPLVDHFMVPRLFKKEGMHNEV